MSRMLPFRSFCLGLGASLALMAGLACAAEVSNPEVKARIALMQAFKGQMKVLSEAAEGKAPFDAAALAAAIAGLQDGVKRIGPAFRAQADDPASEALPEIWANPAEFRQKTNRLGKAVGALDAGSPGALGDTLAPVMAACKDCHGRFKL